MQKTLKFLRDAKTFYVATVDGDRPRLRPFGAIAEYNNRLYICTNNKKECYKQILANPRIEISATIDRSWIRLTGIVKRDASKDAREAVLNAVPSLQKMYKADDGFFEVLYFESGESTFFAGPGAPEKETLYS
jgi:uncharacterized pyridoxamine 5'-phosphate oxidase family protein